MAKVLSEEHRAKLAEGRQRYQEEQRVRQARESETRDASLHEPYRPPGLLPEINLGPDYKVRWIRRSILGQIDTTNFQARRREGWEPISISDVPEVLSYIDKTESGWIEIGGLVACKCPVDIIAKRDAHYAELSRRQRQAVDNDYLNMKDRGVEVFRDPDSGVRILNRS